MTCVRGENMAWSCVCVYVCACHDQLSSSHGLFWIPSSTVLSQLRAKGWKVSYHAMDGLLCFPLGWLQKGNGGSILRGYHLPTHNAYSHTHLRCTLNWPNKPTLMHVIICIYRAVSSILECTRRQRKLLSKVSLTHTPTHTDTHYTSLALSWLSV